MSERYYDGEYFDESNIPARDSTIALDQLPIDLISEPQLEMVDIYAVQSLIMGYLRRRARHTMRDDDLHRYTFSMLDRNFDDDTYFRDAYDGGHHNYMVCKVQKKTHDQWGMIVSFLTAQCSEEGKSTSNRELYRFDWQRNGNRQAWYSSTERRRTEEGLHMRVNSMYPVSSDESGRLRDRMLEFSELVNPVSADSIMVPDKPRRQA